jgi:hypothetical protein
MKGNRVNAHQSNQTPACQEKSSHALGMRIIADRLATVVMRQLPTIDCTLTPFKVADAIAEFLDRELRPALTQADSTCSIIAHRGADKQSENECLLVSRMLRRILEEGGR